MTQEEKLIRARQAAASVLNDSDRQRQYINGKHDLGDYVSVALYALDHLDEPIVDPDLIEVRKMWAERCPHVAEGYLAGRYDKCESTMHTLVAIKRGRELERGE